MANVDILEPFWADATSPGVQRWPRNCAVASGAFDAAPTAHADYKGAIVYVPGTPDVPYINLQSPTADTFSLLRLGTNRRRVLTGASVLTLTDDMSGALIDCGAAEDFVLPALTALNSGAHAIFYDFVVTTTATSLTITAGAADILHGGVMIMSTGAGVENDAFSANGTTDLVITMNGTTQGGIIGSTLRIIAASATKWIVSGQLIGSGTIVTPFS
jgi:hypothetical protein